MIALLHWKRWLWLANALICPSFILIVLRSLAGKMGITASKQCAEDETIETRQMGSNVRDGWGMRLEARWLSLLTLDSGESRSRYRPSHQLAFSI